MPDELVSEVKCVGNVTASLDLSFEPNVNVYIAFKQSLI